jgi:hypothetical protein
MTYSQIPWLPLAGGLALLGFIGSWFAWRRRGVAAALRGVAWSLLPVAAYLTKTVKVLWQVGSAIASWATSFVFSLQVWLGVAVAGLAAVLFVVSGWMRGRKAGKGPATAPGASALGSEAAAALGRKAGAPKPVTAGKSEPARKASGRKTAAHDDDDLADVAEILRRRGIR